MIISKITLKNYRCFIDSEFDFSTNGKMDLIVGVIGTGKTELLFSILWTLYDFEFVKLKNKENTPYSLNERLYNSILTGVEKRSKASVTIEVKEKVEDSDQYRLVQIVKSEVFELSNSGKMSSYFQYEIIRYKPNGEKELPLQTKEQFKKAVGKIIPEKILNGILFDGERMRNLSSNDRTSIETIETIISDITNRSLLEETKRVLGDLKKDYTKERNKLLRKSGQSNSLLAEERESLQSRENEVSRTIDKGKYDLLKLNTRNSEIEDQLLFIEETRAKIDKKRALQHKLKTYTELREQYLDEFTTKIRFSFLVPSTELFIDVKDALESYDVPKGLNIDAVNSILEREYCICGEPLDEVHRDHLRDLLTELPPDNLNATIGEMLKQNEMRRNTFIFDFENGFQNFIKNDNLIIDIEKELSEIQNDIGDTSDSEIKSLDLEFRSINKRIIEIQTELKYSERDLNDIRQRIKQIDDEISEKNQSDFELTKLNRAISKLDKFINLTDGIIEHNKSIALGEINELINSGFRKISEDYSLGRRVYITQFIEPKYKIVPYYIDEYKRINQNTSLDVLKSKYKTINFDDENQYNEILILEAATSSSTGQAKINALSFVYSIMQYTLKDRGKDIIHRNKQYPLVIDAPLSEISGESLNMISRNLSSFNSQVIVMIDDNTYEGAKSNLSNVGKIYRLDKTTENLSTKVVLEK